MDCRVVVEAAVPVYDVTTADEAVRIAISKTGGMLNPDLSYVEIDVGSRSSPSGEVLEPAFIVADEALVALELTMTVFNVEREEHAGRIARKEIGQRLRDIPLDVLEVSVLEEEENGNGNGDEEAAANGTASTEEREEQGKEDGQSRTDPGTEAADADRPVDGSDEDGADGETEEHEEHRENGTRADEDILPEFEDLIDE